MGFAQKTDVYSFTLGLIIVLALEEISAVTCMVKAAQP